MVGVDSANRRVVWSMMAQNLIFWTVFTDFTWECQKEGNILTFCSEREYVRIVRRMHSRTVGTKCRYVMSFPVDRSSWEKL